MAGIIGIDEYVFTLGILIAFVGTIVSIIFARKQILSVLKDSGIRWKHVAAALIIAALFVSVELAIVKPTQLLFFDDAIYQAGAVNLLRTGQAWMCDYGTPYTCYSGEIFHEPIGTSFTLAIGFALFGVHLGVAYHTMLVVALVSVFLSFLVGSVLLKDPIAGLFSELLFGLSPVVLVWSMPTTSDMPMLAYSMLAIFLMLVFLKKKNVFTFMGMLLALSLVAYMKVDAALYIVVVLFLYIILERKENIMKLVRKNVMNTKVLVVILIFALSVIPEVVYSFTQLTTGSYGYQGSYLQMSCTPNVPFIQANSSISLQNFEANLCGNLSFWLNTYKSNYIMQPLFFTLLGIAGAAAMFLKKRREMLALVIWFAAFFVLYTSFYGGSVTFGIDWRFMLALIAPASIFGGYAMSFSYLKWMQRRKMPIVIAKASGIAVLLVLAFYSFYSLVPLLGVQPSALPQAGDARFYEGFVYNNSISIPSSCLVFSYDPTLFIVNNRTSAQLTDIYASSYASYKSEYSCLVFDRGYWCYTPNNYCTYVQNTFVLQNISTSVYTQQNKTYGFYYITGIRNSTNSTA